jgi:hypothetical protein
MQHKKVAIVEAMLDQLKSHLEVDGICFIFLQSRNYETITYKIQIGFHALEY